MKSYDRALEAMRKAAAIKKDDPNVLVNMAELQIDFNRVNDAEAHSCGVLPQRPECEPCAAADRCGHQHCPSEQPRPDASRQPEFPSSVRC